MRLQTQALLVQLLVQKDLRLMVQQIHLHSDTSKVSIFGHTFDGIETNLVGSNEAIPTANAVHFALTSANSAIFDHIDFVKMI